METQSNPRTSVERLYEPGVILVSFAVAPQISLPGGAAVSLARRLVEQFNTILEGCFDQTAGGLSLQLPDLTPATVSGKESEATARRRGWSNIWLFGQQHGVIRVIVRSPHWPDDGIPDYSTVLDPDDNTGMGRDEGVPDDGKMLDPAAAVLIVSSLLQGPRAQEHILKMLEPAGLRKYDVTPNWAMTGESGSGYIVGGPGGRPAPERHSGRWHLSARSRDVPDGVRVVVLDTSPFNTEQEAVQAATPFIGNNPYFAELVGAVASGERPVERWEDVEAWGEDRSRRSGIEADEYIMADHGFFVASIIRDIAPSCRLEVVRVLNDWGCGYLHTLLAGIEYVGHSADGRIPVVVNMSLTIKTPDLAGLNALYAALARRYHAALVPHNLTEVTNPYRSVADAAQPLFASTLVLSPPRSKATAIFVGATGNDSTASSHRDPRAPALFEHVVAVAALGAQLHPAAYSNKGDERERAVDSDDDGEQLNGFAVFGGEPGDHIRGLFSAAQIPVSAGVAEPNRTGWAQWQGTSFATPIIAGIVANLVARDHTLNATAVMAILQAEATVAVNHQLGCAALQVTQQHA